MKSAFMPVNGRFNMEPEYVAEVGNAYVQTHRGAHYTAEVRLNPATGQNACLAISNPCGCGRNICLNETVVANLCDNPLVANMYYCVRGVECAAMQHVRAVPTNLLRCYQQGCGPEGGWGGCAGECGAACEPACGPCAAPCGPFGPCGGCFGAANVMYGAGADFSGGEIGDTFTVTPYATHTEKHAGSVLIAPGCTFVIELNAIAAAQSVSAAVTVKWWEELIA